MPEDRYRHSIICMTEYTDFRYRIKKSDVGLFQLQKREGNDLLVFYRLWKLLRRLKPDIIHTRNLGTLECTLPALLAGVAVRIHGEHGRDMLDIGGTNKKYIILRKIFRPFVSKYIALSKDLEGWLHDSIGISSDKIIQLYNGVDCKIFSPKKLVRDKVPAKYMDKDVIIIGTVGRISAEKDQFNFVQALAILFEKFPRLKDTLRFIIIGVGPLLHKLSELVKDNGLQDYIWLPGVRDDIPELYNEMDVFVLPSLGEGISNTILEAMASGLPVIATNVGGNPELVKEGETGMLVPSADPEKLAYAILKYLDEPEKIKAHGCAGRQRIEENFSMQVMVTRYTNMYDDVMADCI